MFIRYVSYTNTLAVIKNRNPKNMNNTSKWFLSQTPMKIFLLSLLGIPIYFWLFSIIYQLDNKTNENPNNLKITLVGILTIYPILYLFIFMGIFFNYSFGIFEFIMPFHFSAMLCGFLLMILAAKSYVEYEKKKGHKTYETIGVFFMLWFYIIGIWSLQLNLNKYVKE
jgi:hypothetical protein